MYWNKGAPGSAWMLQTREDCVDGIILVGDMALKITPQDRARLLHTRIAGLGPTLKQTTRTMGAEGTETAAILAALAMSGVVGVFACGHLALFSLTRHDCGGPLGERPQTAPRRLLADRTSIC